nr:amino acid permease [Sciscionella marina]
MIKTLKHALVPPIPAWLAALACALAMLAVNVASVRFYGEFEFWFSTIKVAAIIAFIALGVVAFCGGVPSFDTPGLSNLTSQGGFFAEGWSGVVFAAPAVLFSYFGTEIAAVAGGEAKDPGRSVRKAMNSVIFRILVFYIGSILVVVTLLPWNSSQVTDSPYSAVLTQLGIPAVGVVMSLIVLTAVLSCLNSSMYAASRMLYGLAEQHQAPKQYLGTNRRGAPVLAVFRPSSGPARYSRRVSRASFTLRWAASRSSPRERSRPVSFSIRRSR